MGEATLAWSDKIFAYCERGQDAGFWAEPFNAISNAAFLIAAFAAWQVYRRQRRNDPVVRSLIILVGVMGVGSFIFHTVATQWAAIADVAPIGIFMLAYLALALSRFVGLGGISVALCLAGFLGAMAFADGITCSPDVMPVTAAAGRACMNGSLGYAPAWLALALIAALLSTRRHPAARWIATGAAVFAMSLVMRSLDVELCNLTTLFGQVRGTHALWHILNATLLYCLLRAALVPTRGEARK